jgi:hypothetical protein
VENADFSNQSGAAVISTSPFNTACFLLNPNRDPPNSCTQNLADRDGLWQIAIDKGRFGEITPMGEARDESYEVLCCHINLSIQYGLFSTQPQSRPTQFLYTKSAKRKSY